MTFAVPLFLLAALAAVIPVILHLINRQRVKDLPFSTLRFLKISVQKTRRRKRIHDVLLMLIRTAVLLLIALGLSRPTLTNLKSLLGGGAQSAVAIILDNSASMGLIDQGRMRFETALNAAQQILREVPVGHELALFVTCGPDYPDMGKLDLQHDKISQILNQTTVSYERANLTVRLQQARKLLAPSKAVNKEIYVISDMQEISWEGLKKEAEQESENQENLSEEDRKARDIPVIIVDCNRNPQINAAVTGVELDAPVPVAGLPMKAKVEVFNSSAASFSRRVELYIDNNKEGSSPDLTVGPEERTRHEFQFTFKSGGLHRGEVRLAGEDGCRLDDRRFFTMEVGQGIPVGIVVGKRHEIHYLDDAFYLEQALQPAASGASAIRVQILKPSDLLSEPLGTFTAIYCVNVPALDADAADRLRQYVEGGGNLVWICGDEVTPEGYNRMNEEAQKELLPAPLVEIRTPAAGTNRDSWWVTFLEKTHRALRQLAEPVSLYQSVLVYKHARMDLRANADAKMLIGLDDGEALLAQRKVQKGTVMMLGTSAHVTWTNLPLRPIFVPLLTLLTFEMAGTEQTRRSAVAGAPLVLQLDDRLSPTGVEVITPNGSTIRRASQAEEGSKGQVFRYAETNDIGIYVLRVLEGARPMQVAFSVNVDPDEALPKKIDREELKTLFGTTPLVFAEDPDDLTSTFKFLREGKSLWEWFLAGVLAFLVFETFVANRLSPKQEDDLSNVPPGMRRLARKGRSAA